MSLRNPIQEQYICKQGAKQKCVPVEKQKNIYFYLGCLWNCSCTAETNVVVLGLFPLLKCPRKCEQTFFFKQMAVLLLSSYSASAFSLFREKQGTCYSQDVLSQ